MKLNEDVYSARVYHRMTESNQPFCSLMQEFNNGNACLSDSDQEESPGSESEEEDEEVESSSDEEVRKCRFS